jgi:hypothetical protein
MLMLTLEVTKVADHVVVDALGARVAPQLEALEGLRAASSSSSRQHCIRQRQLESVEVLSKQKDI